MAWIRPQEFSESHGQVQTGQVVFFCGKPTNAEAHGDLQKAIEERSYSMCNLVALKSMGRVSKLESFEHLPESGRMLSSFLAVV